MKIRDCCPRNSTRQAESERARSVADYIAGMTDRYAIREHRRIFCHRRDLISRLPSTPGLR